MVSPCGKRIVWAMFILVVLVISFYWIALWIATPQLPDSHPPEILYPFLHPQFEEEWLETLRNGKINHVEVWNPYGLSLKFKVIFEDGKVASGKLMYPFSFWRHDFKQVLFRE